MYRIDTVDLEAVCCSLTSDQWEGQLVKTVVLMYKTHSITFVLE